MESSGPVPAPEGVQGPMRLDRLPRELLLEIIEFLTFEPNVTTGDQTVQRRQNLPQVCLVSNSLFGTTIEELYKTVHISTERRLRLFSRTVRSQPALATHVRNLSFDLELCGENISGPRNRELCSDMYWILNQTTEVRVLSLNLMECNCCFRNSVPEHIAANGTNAGYDLFYERVSNRIRDESTINAESRRFLPEVLGFHFNSTERPYAYRDDFALRHWNV